VSQTTQYGIGSRGTKFDSPWGHHLPSSHRGRLHWICNPEAQARVSSNLTLGSISDSAVYRYGRHRLG
jgi:hypothetical protein